MPAMTSYANGNAEDFIRLNENVVGEVSKGDQKITMCEGVREQRPDPTIRPDRKDGSRKRQRT